MSESPHGVSTSLPLPVEHQGCDANANFSLGLSRVNTRSPTYCESTLAHPPAAPLPLGRRYATMRGAQHGKQQTIHSRRRLRRHRLAHHRTRRVAPHAQGRRRQNGCWALPLETGGIFSRSIQAPLPRLIGSWPFRVSCGSSLPYSQSSRQR